MPSQTFLNLPKEKQKTLLHAAIKEFTNVSYEDVSINRIIKEAGIPRGSFYMYFENKEDLYFYLLNNYKIRFQEKLLELIQEEKGDIFETFIKLYEAMIDFCMSPRKIDFFKQVFTNINSKTENHLFPKREPQETLKHSELYQQFLSHIDRTILVRTSDSDVEEMVELLFMMTIHTTIHSFVRSISKDDAKSTYQRKMELLKYGMKRK